MTRADSFFDALKGRGQLLALGEVQNQSGTESARRHGQRNP